MQKGRRGSKVSSLFFIVDTNLHSFKERTYATAENECDINDDEDLHGNEFSFTIESVTPTPKLDDDQTEHNIARNTTETREDNDEDLDELGEVLPLGTSELSVEEVTFEEVLHHELQCDSNVYITGNVEGHENALVLEEPTPVSIDDIVSENISSVEIVYPRDISMEASEPAFQAPVLDGIDLTPIGK